MKISRTRNKSRGAGWDIAMSGLADMEGAIFVSFPGEGRVVLARTAVPECKFRRVRVSRGRTKFLLVEAELPLIAAANGIKVIEEELADEYRRFQLVPETITHDEE
jgi:hypothetical protein